jgi:GWxTD domain-containing protein
MPWSLRIMFVLLFSGPLWLSAQWSLMVKGSLAPAGNTRTFLAYEAPLVKAKHFLATLAFRPRGTYRTFLVDEQRLDTDSSEVFVLDYELPPGEYEVEVDIHDLDLNTYQTVQIDHHYVVLSPGEVRLSDIYLCKRFVPEQVFKRPIMRPSLEIGTDSVFYFLQLLAPGYQFLTVRAVLYRETGQQPQAGTHAYSSLQQTNEVISVRPGNQPTLFSGRLDLAPLQAGEYLIDVLVYDNSSRVGRVRTRFELGGEIRRRIFADLNTSIRMMEYALPVDKLEELLQYPDEAVKEEAFLKAWENLYPGEAEDQMEAYFQKIYAANERYPEGNLPGWRTDRGRIFIQYGEGREKSLTLNGKAFIRWTYARWSLSFLFEPRNQGYVLVE